MQSSTQEVTGGKKYTDFNCSDTECIAKLREGCAKDGSDSGI